ncbi:MAG TPA: hypothetical protein VI893_09090 [Thermoplasmata archaeon]|nr:hypothetical protein [Thermoplasmata archaeon]
MKGFSVAPEVRPGEYRLPQVFRGVEDAPALIPIFGEDVAAALAEIVVQVSDEDLYAYVDDEDGRLVVGLEHITSSDARTVYLDVVHELVHVKQHREGRELYDRRYRYVDRPTEVEAYRVAVEEARRIGMDDKEIFEYLHVEWISAEEHRRLAMRLGVEAR